MPAKRAIDIVKQQNVFLEGLAEGMCVADAARSARTSKTTVYRWRKADKKFAEDWDDAYECGADVLLAEAQRRGVNGVDEPVYYQGQTCGAVRKYSDTLLMFMMKARDPLRFCDRARTAHLLRKWEKEDKNSDDMAGQVIRDNVIAMLDGLAALNSSQAKSHR
jgi:hypothetical protein